MNAPPKPSHETRVGNRGILDFQHRHADGGRRVRVFAHGADVHAEARLIEHDGGQAADDEGEVGQQAVPRKNAAQERNFVQQGNRDVRNAERRGDQTRRRRHCLALGEVRDDLAQKQRAARAHHVDGNARRG